LVTLSQQNVSETTLLFAFFSPRPHLWPAADKQSCRQLNKITSA
jgi:hypothetical protein